MKDIVFQIGGILIVSLLVGGCAFFGKNSQVQEWAKDADKALTKYQEEIRPRAVKDLSLLFGVDEEGNVEIEPNADAPIERMGIQDFVASKFGEFSTDQKKRLRDINQRGIDMFLRIQRIDAVIQDNKDNTRKVLDDIVKLNRSLEGSNFGEKAAAFLKTAVEIYAKTS